MGYYKILSEPLSKRSLDYKGLYRSEPLPQSGKKNRFFELWQRYSHDSKGITTELTVSELKELANLASQATDSSYEVVFFDEKFDCPHESVYYGIDVTSWGGYSMLGEGLFYNREENKPQYPYYFVEIINQYFGERINQNGLFENLEDAINFQCVLRELNQFFPNYIEQEDWHIVHIFSMVI